MNIFGGVGRRDPRNNQLDFGGDAEHDPLPEF